MAIEFIILVGSIDLKFKVGFGIFELIHIIFIIMVISMWYSNVSACWLPPASVLCLVSTERCESDVWKNKGENVYQ
jgi:hypothetical protein